MTSADVIWIGIPVAIVVIFVLGALVTQSRGSNGDEPAPDPTPAERDATHNHDH